MPNFADRVRELEAQSPSTPIEQQKQAVEVVKGTDPTVSFADRVRQREQLMQQGIHTPSVQEADKSSRDSALAFQIRAKGFEDAQVGSPGLTDLGLRADLGFSDTFAEKRAKFMDSFPGGDFIEVPEPQAESQRTPLGRGGSTILFRKNQDEPFAELDAGVLDKFELLGDLADLSGELPAAIVEAIVTRGGSLVATALQLFVGTITGDAIKEVVQSLRGYQKETFTEQVERIGARGAISAGVGGPLTSMTMAGPINSLRGAASIRLLPNATAAQRAAQELHIPALLPNQIASSPIIQRIGRQSRATVDTINRYIRRQAESAVRALSRLRDVDALKFAIGAPDGISRLHDEAVAQITLAAKSSKRSLTEGGEALQAGLVEYEDLSGAIVDRAYAVARQKGTPEFDIRPALAVARDIKAGVLGKAKDGSEVQLQEVAPAVKAEIAKLEALDPSLPTMTMPDGTLATATDQLRAIRSNLWSLKQTGPTGLTTPEERRTAAQASKLYAAINRVLKTPKNADPAFAKAWAVANAEAKKRFDTLEKIIVVQASKSETPAQLANRLVKPYQIDNLRVLKDTVPADKFEIFRQAALADLIASNNINSLSRRLQSFDQETLDILFPRGTQRTLKQIGKRVDRLNQAGIQEAVARQGKLAEIVRDLTNRKDQAGIDEFVKRVSTLPPNDPRRKTVRAGVVEDVWNNSVRRTDEGFEVDGQALATEVKRLRDTGVAKLLTANDLRILGLFDDLAGFLKTSEDAGTSLAAASTAAGLRSFSAAALHTLLEVRGTGWLFTSELGQRLLLGGGKEKLPFSKLRVFNAVLGNALSDAGDTVEPDQQ